MWAAVPNPRSASPFLTDLAVRFGDNTLLAVPAGCSTGLRPALPDGTAPHPSSNPLISPAVPGAFQPA